MSEKVLEIKGLKVNYEQFRLNVDDYSIEKGYVTGLIGKNGSGKTTLINAFLDLIRRDAGDIHICGLTLEKNEIEIKERIAYVNDQFIYPLSLNAARLGREIGVFYHQFNYPTFEKLCSKHAIPMDMNFKNFSRGMKAKVCILFALSYDPDFLILDEPTASLDPIGRREILDLLYDFMQNETKTILFSTHITSDLDKIADKITLIHEGRIEFTKTKDEIQEDNQLVTIEGDIPQKMKNYIKGLIKTDGGFKGLCIDTTLFEESDHIKFSKASVEDILYYWEIHNA